MDTVAGFRSVVHAAESRVAGRIQNTLRERVSAAAFSWLDPATRSLVEQGAEYQRKTLPRQLRKMAHIDLRSERTERFVRTRVSRLLDQPSMMRDSGEVSLALRPRLIARTETNAALFFGRHELIWQLIERGLLRPDQITKQWIARLDRKTRDSHVGLHRQVRTWGTSFVSPVTGAFLEHPHDSRAPASEVMECRCSEIIRVRVW